jgi:hypothetical protein
VIGHSIEPTGTGARDHTVGIEPTGTGARDHTVGIEPTGTGARDHTVGIVSGIAGVQGALTARRYSQHEVTESTRFQGFEAFEDMVRKL